MMLKASQINEKFADYLLENSFVSLSDMANKGYSTMNNDKYNKILSELDLNEYTDPPLVDVKEYYKKKSGKRTKRGG